MSSQACLRSTVKLAPVHVISTNSFLKLPSGLAHRQDKIPDKRGYFKNTF